MEFNAHDYTIYINYAMFDGEWLYEATVKELPNVADYAETHERALELILDTIALTKKSFDEMGMEFPKPFDVNEVEIKFD